MSEQTAKLLEKQLQLLSEKSQNDVNGVMELSILSDTMVKIAKLVIILQEKHIETPGWKHRVCIMGAAPEQAKTCE